MTMLCPRPWLSGSRRMRAIASVEPPGGKLTTRVMAWLGYSWPAAASGAMIAAAAAPPRAKMNSRRLIRALSRVLGTRSARTLGVLPSPLWGGVGGGGRCCGARRVPHNDPHPGASRRPSPQGGRVRRSLPLAPISTSPKYALAALTGAYDFDAVARAKLRLRPRPTRHDGAIDGDGDSTLAGVERLLLEERRTRRNRQ